MVDLARLTVRLEAENAKLTKALKKSSNDIRRFEGTAKKSFNAFKSAASAAFAGISVAVFIGSVRSAVNEMLDANDKIAKLSQTTGISVEELQSFSLAAKLAGTDIDSVAKGTARLQRNMFDAVAGLKESKDAFDALGISVTDSQGNLRDTEDVLLELADKFSAIEDGAGKAALAQKLLGRAGVSLIPLLNQGSQAIRAYTDEQRELGNVLTTEVARASERVNDNFTRLGEATDGVKRQLTEGLLKALEDVTDAFVGFAQDTDSAAFSLGEFAGGALRSAVSGLLLIKAPLDALGKTIGQVAASLVAVAGGEFSRAYDIIMDDTDSFISEFEEAFEGIEQVWDGVANNVQSRAEENSDKLASPLVLAAQKAAKAKKTFADVTESLRTQNDSLNARVRGIEDEYAITLKLAEARKQLGRDLTPQETTVIVDLAKQGDAYEEIIKKQEESKQIIEDSKPALQQLNEELERGRQLFDEGFFGSGPESEETLIRFEQGVREKMTEISEKTKETTDEMTTYADQAARNMQDSFADYLFDPFQENGLKGMLDGFVITLRQMAAQAASAKIFDSLLGAGGNSFLAFIGLAAGSSGGGGFTGTALHARALGGPVAEGVPYLVGERGPELFVPKNSGGIVPNDKIGALTVNVNVSGERLPAARQSASQIGAQIGQAVNLSMRRNS